MRGGAEPLPKCKRHTGCRRSQRSWAAAHCQSLNGTLRYGNFELHACVVVRGLLSWADKVTRVCRTSRRHTQGNNCKHDHAEDQEGVSCSSGAPHEDHGLPYAPGAGPWPHNASCQARFKLANVAVAGGQSHRPTLQKLTPAPNRYCYMSRCLQLETLQGAFISLADAVVVELGALLQLPQQCVGGKRWVGAAAMHAGHTCQGECLVTLVPW